MHPGALTCKIKTGITEVLKLEAKASKSQVCLFSQNGRIVKIKQISTCLNDEWNLIIFIIYLVHAGQKIQNALSPGLRWGVQHDGEQQETENNISRKWWSRAREINISLRIVSSDFLTFYPTSL